jgi:putative phage-type endonuclease
MTTPAGITYYPVRQLSREWEELHAMRITASIAAGALGKNPYQGPRQAWRMVMGIEPHKSSWYMLHGREFEPVAVKCYEQQTGRECKECGFFVPTFAPWLGASPDRTVGSNGLLEVKCSGKIHGECESHWRVQATVQLICTGRDWCDVCHYRGGTVSIWRVDRTDCESTLAALEQWHRDYVLTKTPPPMRPRGRKPKGGVL